MVFEYDIYYNQTFITPIISIVLLILWISFPIYNFIKTDKKTDFPSAIVTLLLFVFIGIFFMTMNIMSLINGGAYLCKEDSNDAIVESGIIENICEPSDDVSLFKVRYNGHYRFGADVMIDGEEYFAVTCEGLEIGDYVEFEYLPNSKFILCIDKIDLLPSNLGSTN